MQGTLPARLQRSDGAAWRTPPAAGACEVTRRALLQLFGVAAASLLAPAGMKAMAAVPAVTAVDHLLLGVADLDQGIAWVEQRTGVTPAIGGSHPGRGTRNALASLGARQYLEVIAPDPAQKTFTFQLDIRTLKEPRLINWAAAAADIDAIARSAKAANRQTFGPADGSRVRPDGKVLKWRSLGLQSAFGSGAVDPVPFFIQWAPDSVHPAQDSPKGCELKALELAHPTPPALVELLASVGIDARVTQAAAPALRATLNTPKGIVELT
ncbi:MAG TPA: VOC family protein [Vicinamibacterales bacterium]|nr:VOC family protein [Vicinamibacterales bacterium]